MGAETGKTSTYNMGLAVYNSKVGRN